MVLSEELKSAFNYIDENNLTEFLQELGKKIGPMNIINNIQTLQDKELQEPILNPRNFKLTAFPIEYQDIYFAYKNQVANFWIPEEIDLSMDKQDYNTMTEGEKFFLKMILAFFASSDNIVNLNLGERFIKEVQSTDVQLFYHFQMAMEDIHSLTYSLMLENIIDDKDEREFLFNAVQTIPAVKEISEWAFKWIDGAETFAQRLVAFALLEGVFFSGAFAAIFWIKHYKNKGDNAGNSRPFMDGLIKSNKFISRDEGLHTKFAALVYQKLKYTKLSSETISNITKEAVDIACNFMTESLPVELLGMNSDLMCKYIEYIGDRLLSMLGYKKIYNSENPFDFMKNIGLDDKTNFFETRAHEYQNSNALNKSKKVFEINLNF